MKCEEFYTMLDQAGHRLGNLAKNNAGYEFELYNLIGIVRKWVLDDFQHSFNLSGLGNSDMINPVEVIKALSKFKNEN